MTDFYKITPFPNYKDDDNKQTILEKGDRNLLARKFKKFIGFKKKVLEVGCGTGQLSIYFSFVNRALMVLSKYSFRVIVCILKAEIELDGEF